MISAIIPSFKEPLLKPTVADILKNAVGEIEVICVLDGNWVTPEIDDPRIRLLHLGKVRGMRDAINAGVSIARGDILMRSDAHCSFAPGFDKVIADSIGDNEIMTATRYTLDPLKWELMDNPPVNFCKLAIKGDGEGRKFSAVPFKERDEKMRDVMIAETEGMQGSVWWMKRSWWEKVIVELQTGGYGPLIQDSHEMHFKTLQAGGRMVLNKNTWHSHRERSFGRTHDTHNKEMPANCDAGYKYALEQWEEYYLNVARPRWDAMYARGE